MERLGGIQSTARGPDWAGAQDEEDSSNDEAAETEPKS